MSAVQLSVHGGNRMGPVLTALQSAVGVRRNVKVGFIDKATYPAEERGAERLLRGLDKLNSTGPFKAGQKPGRLKAYRNRRKAFVGPQRPASSTPRIYIAQAAFWNEFGTSTAPARPYFRNMIKRESPDWGKQLGERLVDSEYDSTRALSLMGTVIKDELQESINEWPADNAPLTIAIKGFDKGLVDRGIMLRSVDYEVQT